MDPARVLWEVLPATATADHYWAAARTRGRTEFYLRSTAWRTRRRTSIRRDHSRPRLVPRRRYLSDAGLQLSRSQQYRRVQHLLAHYLVLGLNSRLGIDAALSAPVESRPVSSGLRQSNRASQCTDHRRLGLPSTRFLSMRTGHCARILPGGSRSAQHAEPRLQWQFSLANVRRGKRLLRLGLYQWPAQRPISRGLSAGSHYIRHRSRQV